ncbi:MAG: polysaccharide biosynthesis/export family protein [Rhodospirillales bacterium]|nr:polysaccharide biosynthesis/export family protein [Rhodospirillales bacterium]MDP6646202.1 polysaccharide biosynthesis/export family protein [Rhodospirillales bacterium]MDP6840120.1 polysaccharide biosynthesis/export family protein [Rhodospirillales bacterium]
MLAAWIGVIQVPAIAAESAIEYQLGSGDKLKITVFGEKDLSGNFELAGNGEISMPLIGKIGARNETVRGLETKISQSLRKYLKTPQVTVEVLNYRPFYILGEIKKPGNYAYVAGISVLNAVAMAGGFTYRADKGDIVVKRANKAKGREERVTESTTVLPGDIITIKQRFF